MVNKFIECFFLYPLLTFLLLNKVATRWGVDPHTIPSTASFQDWVQSRLKYRAKYLGRKLPKKQESRKSIKINEP